MANPITGTFICPLKQRQNAKKLAISHAGHLVKFCNPHEFLVKIRDFTHSQG